MLRIGRNFSGLRFLNINEKRRGIYIYVIHVHFTLPTDRCLQMAFMKTCFKHYLIILLVQYGTSTLNALHLDRIMSDLSRVYLRPIHKFSPERFTLPILSDTFTCSKASHVINAYCDSLLSSDISTEAVRLSEYFHS